MINLRQLVHEIARSCTPHLVRHADLRPGRDLLRRGQPGASWEVAMALNCLRWWTATWGIVAGVHRSLDESNASYRRQA